MLRQWIAVIVVGGLLLTSCSGGGSPDDDVATPEVIEPATVGADRFRPGLYGAGAVVAWGAYVEFFEDGTGRVRGPVGASSETLRPHDSEFTYVIDGRHVEVTATTGDCEAGATGTYSWSTDATALRLADPWDRCWQRSRVLHGDWMPLGDTPVLEVDPGGAPVPIDSPIGPIEWRFVPGQAYVRDRGRFDVQLTRPQLVAVEGGFVAVVDEQAEATSTIDESEVADRVLVFSQDGVDWRPIPPPPSTVGLIAADGVQVYVAPAGAPDAVHVTTDRGGTWTALEVEDPPDATAGLDAGPAGVVLVGSDAALWLLDEESFQKVATAPAPFMRVLVLDTGFFALSVEAPGPDQLENAQRSYWHSDDGRTWTEASDVPTDVHDRDTTHWGDTVYRSDWSDGIGHTSTDGGRTWSTPTRRPGEGLAVTEAGYFTVQPAVFGPTVGVVWVSSDGQDWQRVVNPWPPLWTFPPVVSGNTILVPGAVGPPFGDPARLDLVGYIN